MIRPLRPDEIPGYRAPRYRRRDLPGWDGCHRTWTGALDLGRVRDVSALVLVESVRRGAGRETHMVRHLETWAPGTSLLTVADDVAARFNDPGVHNADEWRLSFDAGGLGQGFRDSLAQSKPAHVSLLPVSWTGGDRRGRTPDGTITVPVAIAVSDLIHMLETGQLVFADGLQLLDRLFQELAGLRAAFGRAGRVSIDLARDAMGHSDLASACLLAAAAVSAPRPRISWVRDGAPRGARER